MLSSSFIIDTQTFRAVADQHLAAFYLLRNLNQDIAVDFQFKVRDRTLALQLQLKLQRLFFARAFIAPCLACRLARLTFVVLILEYLRLDKSMQPELRI